MLKLLVSCFVTHTARRATPASMWISCYRCACIYLPRLPPRGAHDALTRSLMTPSLVRMYVCTRNALGTVALRVSVLRPTRLYYRRVVVVLSNTRKYDLPGTCFFKFQLSRVRYTYSRRNCCTACAVRRTVYISDAPCRCNDGFM